MLDGNWVEMTTLVFGCIGILIKPIIRKIRKSKLCWIFRDVANDFLNSASLAPFILLFIGVFNTWIFDELVKSGKTSLGLAGGIGVLYVLKELFTIPNSE